MISVEAAGCVSRMDCGLSRHRDMFPVQKCLSPCRSHAPLAERKAELNTPQPSGSVSRSHPPLQDRHPHCLFCILRTTGAVGSCVSATTSCAGLFIVCILPKLRYQEILKARPSGNRNVDLGKAAHLEPPAWLRNMDSERLRNKNVVSEV
jgi:hypothetical protein